MEKILDRHKVIDDLINQLNLDIQSYQNAIIDNSKPLSEETVAYYQSQITETQNGISALQQEKIKLGG